MCLCVCVCVGVYVHVVCMSADMQVYACVHL